MNLIRDYSKYFRALRLLAVGMAAIALSGCASESKSTGGKAAAVEKMPKVENNSLQGNELFDGKTLSGWEVTDYGGHGKVEVENGVIVVGAGDALTGINWTNQVKATDNYELTLSARRVSGSDFFCGLTFPVGNTNCTLIVGGWGGTVVGLSSINGEDASENETSQFVRFENGKWYAIKLRVTTAKIEMWLDNERLINFERADKVIGLRFGQIDMSLPLGLTTYQTVGEIKEFQWKKL